jgi:hypothetical protein
MEQVRKLLLTIFVVAVTMALLLVVVFETGLLEPGTAAGDRSVEEVSLTFVVELLTIAVIPVALRLFKFKRVEADLKARHEQALRKWGVLRLSMLESILLANTLLYYVFMNTSFGYLAIIILLCMPFVYPSKEKCMAEAFMEDNGNEA